MESNLHNKSFLKLVVRMEEIEIQQCNLDKERKEIIKEIEICIMKYNNGL